MAEIARRVEVVAHALLQGLHVREAAVPHPFPEERSAQRDAEQAPLGWDEGDLAEIVAKG
jgi:hypothetical protein